MIKKMVFTPVLFSAIELNPGAFIPQLVLVGLDKTETGLLEIGGMV